MPRALARFWFYESDRTFRLESPTRSLLFEFEASLGPVTLGAIATSADSRVFAPGLRCAATMDFWADDAGHVVRPGAKFLVRYPDPIGHGKVDAIGDDGRDVPPYEVVSAKVGEIVRRLADKDYDGLCRDQLAYRQRPEWLARAIGEYGRTLVPLPDEAFALTELGPITARPKLWWLVQPLWTEEEGRSDLDLIGGITRTDTGWNVYFEDLRVQ